MKKRESKIRDYVLIGVFSAINAVLIALGGMITAVMGPIYHIVMSTAIAGLMNGTIILILAKKTNVKWLFTIIYFITMIIFQMIGQGYLPWVATTLISAVFADLVSIKSNYKNNIFLAVSHGLTIIGLACGSIIPVLLFAEKFKNDFVSRGVEASYLDNIISFYKGYMTLGVIVMSFIFGLLGIFIGNRLLKKHFEKAGIV
jgi:energy-coupling factor transport system substrate-specific component